MCQTPFLPLWQPQMYSLMSYLRLWLLKHLTASMPLFIACLNCLFRIRLHIISLVWAWSCVIGFWQTCNLEAHTDGCWPSFWLKAISMPLYCLLLLNFVATRLCIIYIYILCFTTHFCLWKKMGLWPEFWDQGLWLFLHRKTLAEKGWSLLRNEVLNHVIFTEI